MRIGATRCDGKCENTVSLETQEPSGRVRRWKDITRHKNTGENVTRVTLGVTFAGSSTVI